MICMYIYIYIAALLQQSLHLCSESSSFSPTFFHSFLFIRLLTFIFKSFNTLSSESHTQTHENFIYFGDHRYLSRLEESKCMYLIFRCNILFMHKQLHKKIPWKLRIYAFKRVNEGQGVPVLFSRRSIFDYRLLQKQVCYIKSWALCRGLNMSTIL